MRVIVRLNRTAQGSLPTDSLYEWFREKDEAGQESALGTLGFITSQAHPVSEMLVSALEQTRGKPTGAAAKLMTKAVAKGSLRWEFAEVSELPTSEWDEGFRLMFALFSIADAKRREECGLGCRHWWHQDLTDERVLEEVFGAQE